MKNAALDQTRLKALLRSFKEQHAQEYGLRTLGFFGSYARNEATVDSDIDIVFDTDSPNLFRAVVMKQELEGLLGRRVDLLQLRGLTDPGLRARVEREAVYV